MEVGNEQERYREGCLSRDLPPRIITEIAKMGLLGDILQVPGKLVGAIEDGIEDLLDL